MNLLSAENISKNYGDKQLFDHINMGINQGDKIGVIGINGSGKTTLLKIIAGVESSDTGKLIKGNAVNIEYLPQNPDFDPTVTVLGQVFKGNSPIMKLIREYQEAINNAETSNDRMISLTHEMDTMNAWSIESEAKTILTKLGVSDFTAKVGTLSGGQKKRIALAAALINPSDLLILDEPTNHLDNDTIDWLEQYLNQRKGSLLMITHDRYFLDRVVNQIVEIDRGSLYTYQGNYSVFLEKKIEREEIEAASEKKKKGLFRKELAWIRKGAKARTTKQKARIDRFEKLNEEVAKTSEEKLDISIPTTRLGKKVIEIEHISKSFDNKKIIEDFSYIVQRDDRVGIVGPNGTGKSTLINILCGRLNPDGGKIEVGETVKIGLFAQETNHMDEDLRVIEYIREGAEYCTTAEGQKISASQMLERFLFPSDLQWTPLSKLSGGEKRRLYLLRVLMEAPNVLLLDEPTNDLDIESLTILEDYLDDFQGAVIAVSHDRYFLDRTAGKILSCRGDGQITHHTGNYSDFARKHNEQKVIEQKEKESVNRKSAIDKNKDNQRRKDKPLKFSYKEQKEYEEIDDIIGELENKIQEMDSRITDASTDYTLLQTLVKEKEELEHNLEEKMERWVYLNDLAERIGQV